MSPECPPPFDLNLVYFRKAPPQIVPTIPLEPATRVGANNPTLVSPGAQRLATLNTKVVDCWVRAFASFRILEPAAWQFIFAIVAIFTFEYTHLKHGFRTKLRFKSVFKIWSQLCWNLIFIRMLHPIVHGNFIADYVQMLLNRPFHTASKIGSRGRTGPSSFANAPAALVCFWIKIFVQSSSEG